MKINESVFRPLFEKYCKEGTRPYLYVLGLCFGGEYISEFTERAWQNYKRGVLDYMNRGLPQANRLIEKELPKHKKGERECQFCRTLTTNWFAACCDAPECRTKLEIQNKKEKRN